MLFDAYMFNFIVTHVCLLFIPIMWLIGLCGALFVFVVVIAHRVCIHSVYSL